MTVGVRNFQGSRLREARLARGLFMNALGDLVGVTGTAISRFEQGEDNPQAERLDAIAHQLKFPVEFFLAPTWPENISLIHWRSRASESKSAREMTEQRVRWLLEIFSFLNEEVDFPKENIPYVKVPNDFNLITSEHIEEASAAVRNAWGLRMSPISDMILALENAGIPVVTLKIPSDKQDGLCFKSAILQRHFVGINVEGTSCVRARFDAAHELGHLVLHRNVTPEQARTPAAHKLIEQQAHRFASSFIFPRESFISEVDYVSIDYFSALKRKWGMSIAAMIMRAFDVGLIDEEGKERLFRSMTIRKWRGRLREPYDSYRDMPLERPRMLRRGFETIIHAGLFANSVIRSALPQPVREIEELACLEPGTLEIKAQDIQVPLRNRSVEVTDLESGNVIQFNRKNWRK